MTRDERSPDLLDSLSRLADKYHEDAQSVMRDDNPQWGLEIMLADCIEVCRRRGLDPRDVFQSATHLHGQRTDEGAYKEES